MRCADPLLAPRSSPATGRPSPDHSGRTSMRVLRKESVMPTKRPSFLKRQKEQKRAARALEKREARRERAATKSTGQADSDAPREDSETPESPTEETLLNTE